MESNKYSYKLIQKNKTYILTISVFGNDIKISVKSEGSTTELMRVLLLIPAKKLVQYLVLLKMLQRQFNG